MTPEDLLRKHRETLRTMLAEIDELLGPEQTDLFGGELQGDLEKRKSHKLAPEGLQRIKAVYGSRPSTFPNLAEVKLYNGIAKRLGKEALYEQIDTVTRFYSFRKEELERGNTNLWPTSAVRLMKHWDEIQDRANSFLASKPKVESKEDRPAIPEPYAWRSYAESEYTEKGHEYWKSVDWNELPDYVKTDIHKKCR